MIARARCVAASLTVLLLGSLLSAQVTLPQKRGEMEARLTVAVAPSTPQLGLGALTLTLTIEGPATLDVEEPHLHDVTASWKEERRPSTQTIEKARARWSQVIRLKQVKLGVEAPPDVSVRFRAGPDDTWEEAKWVDILKQMREGLSPPEPPAPSPSWLWRWRLPLVLGLLILSLGAWLVWRWRGRPAPPLSPDQYALRELARIEETLRSAQGDAEVFHTQLSHIIRRYLAERFGLHAFEQTTAEFLETVRQVPQVSAEQQALLRDLFERCDLAKFARASTSPEECRRTAEMVRELVRLGVSHEAPGRNS
jgi:Domain of unknown function (DUF4381)